MVGDPLQLQSVPEQFAPEKGLSQDVSKIRFLWDTSLFKKTFLPYDSIGCTQCLSWSYKVALVASTGSTFAATTVRMKFLVAT